MSAIPRAGGAHIVAEAEPPRVLSLLVRALAAVGIHDRAPGGVLRDGVLLVAHRGGEVLNVFDAAGFAANALGGHGTGRPRGGHSHGHLMVLAKVGDTVGARVPMVTIEVRISLQHDLPPSIPAHAYSALSATGGEGCPVALLVVYAKPHGLISGLMTAFDAIVVYCRPKRALGGHWRELKSCWAHKVPHPILQLAHGGGSGRVPHTSTPGTAARYRLANQR